MAEGSSERSARAESGEIATSTLAEIYAQQGLLGRALSIYRRMLTRTPEDAEIVGRIQTLERRIAEAGPEPEVPPPLTSRVERERLPWDPPVDEVPEAGPEETPAPAAEPVAEQPAAHEPAEPAVEAEAIEAARRVGPIDAQAFETWLEGR
jgi:hypothetical protein